jgi:MtN3 and saliva related transmembrane protein
LVSADVIGYIGGALVAVSFLPQLVRIIKLRAANEISIYFTSTMFGGCLIWTAYGFYMQQLPMMIFSVINTSQVGLLMTLKYIYARNPKKRIIDNQLARDTETVVTLEDTQKLVEETKKPVELVLN